MNDLIYLIVHGMVCYMIGWYLGRKSNTPKQEVVSPLSVNDADESHGHLRDINIKKKMVYRFARYRDSEDELVWGVFYQGKRVGSNFDTRFDAEDHLMAHRDTYDIWASMGWFAD